MDKIVAYESKDYSIGSRTFGPFQVPLKCTRAKLIASRENWPEKGREGKAPIIHVKIDLSLDGGKTWIDTYVGFTAYGGEVRKVDNTVSPASTVARALPEPDNPNRMIRGIFENAENLKSEISLELEYGNRI